MELQPRSQPRSRPLNRSVDEQPNETSHGTGGNGTRCLVGLDVLLPGRPQPQPVELYFDAEWAATADPVSVHFENSSGVTINSEQAAAWEDDNLLAVQLEPIDIKHLHLAGRKADTRSRRNFIPFQAVAMALLAITLTALYTRYSNASPGDGPKTQQPCVISLHEILNNATSSYVDAAVLMTKPVTSPGGSRGLSRPIHALGYISGTMSSLCRYAAKVPARPDLEELCGKYNNASATASWAVGLFGSPKTAAQDIWERLESVSRTLASVDRKRWNQGETQGDNEDEDEGENMRWERHRRQDGRLAGTLLEYHMSDWHDRYAPAQKRLRTLESCLRDMEGWAAYIAEGFEYELKRDVFHKLDVPDIREDIEHLRLRHMPFAAVLLNHTSTAVALLEGGESQLAELTEALTVMWDAYDSAPDPNPHLLPFLIRFWRLQVEWGAVRHCELSNIFWSQVKMEEAALVLRDKVMEAQRLADGRRVLPEPTKEPEPEGSLARQERMFRRWAKRNGFQQIYELGWDRPWR